MAQVTGVDLSQIAPFTENIKYALKSIYIGAAILMGVCYEIRVRIFPFRTDHLKSHNTEVLIR